MRFKFLWRYLLVWSVDLLAVAALLAVVLDAVSCGRPDGNPQLPPAPPAPEVPPVAEPGPPPAPAPDTTIYVAWLIHPDETVLGYRVYVGATLDLSTMTMQREVEPRTTTATEFAARADLGASDGDQVCVRLTAFNADGESPPSFGVCVVLA